MKNVFLLQLFLIVVSCPVFSQKAGLDSLLKVVKNLPDDTVKIRRLYQLSEAYSSFDLKQEKVLLHQSYHLAKQVNAETRIPELEMGIGRSSANLSQPDSALFYFNKALQGFENQNNQKSIAKVYSKIRWVYNYLGDFEKALRYAFKALEIYRKFNDSVGLASVYSDISVIFYSQQKFEDAANYAQKAYDLQKKQNLLDNLAYSAQSLGDAWLQLGDYPKALNFQNEGLAIRRKLSSEIDVALSLNSRANVYKYLKRYDRALDDYRESLKIARKAGFTGLVLSCLGNIGHVYNLVGKYNKALPYHFENRRLIRQTQQLDKAVENYQLLAEAYGAISKYDSAYYFQKLTTIMGDSLLNEQNNLQMARLKTQFETEQKEEEIKRQRDLLEEDHNKLWALTIFLALTLLVGAMLFILIRTLRKRNQEKEYLIKEIHHRVKNNLQVLASLLHLQGRYIKDEAALDAVREGQSRVEAMGLIHQKLYMGENVAAVDMVDYIHNLGNSLLDSYGLSDDDRIQISYNLQPLQLDVDTAIPIGLIINELVTNSLKYAFPDRRSGIIQIALCEDASKKLCLQVNDDGVGRHQAPELKNSTSFGTNLVKILSKKLKGSSQVLETTHGYATLIRFERYKLA
ncbi:tetratricopeptide repeat protein [Runella sp.]|uniref:tetratricopeptide repeat-containing sensor histidine kinase n=1 Tax=Runella sp. TaxID=1960881 RepID=UPI00262343BA|nr:tetratricopeptide repeat protein [Runella sp.]